MKKLFFAFVLLAGCLCNLVALPYSTRAFRHDVRSIYFQKNENWGQLPILFLGSEDKLRLSFDVINTSEAERFVYRVVHCTADWEPSSLSEQDYLQGFNHNLVNDFANSQTATVNYVNYQIALPNEDFRLKLSGNYVVEVFEENSPENVILAACFYVLDSRVKVQSDVSPITDLGANNGFQQLSLKVDYSALPVNDPSAELKVVSLQNRRGDNRRMHIRPAHLNGKSAIYEHISTLIFDGGNEYRRMEILDTKSAGMNVANIHFSNGSYRAEVMPDAIRADKFYLYDEDQNGRFLVRMYDTENADTEADYVQTTFTLKADKPLSEKVYWVSDVSDYQLLPQYEMQYDARRGAYTLTLLLKQGIYNYLYLTPSASGLSAQFTEGNYSQTENEYLTLVYHRPFGQRYDALVGYSLIRSQIERK